LSALNPLALSLDYVGAITRDPGAAGARRERLGFKLSALSRQSGAVPRAVSYIVIELEQA